MGQTSDKTRVGKLLQLRLNDGNVGYFERMRRYFSAEAKDGEVLKRLLDQPDVWSEIAHDSFDEGFHLMKVLQKISTRTPLTRSEWMLLATGAHDAYMRTRRSRANVGLYLDVLSATLALVHHIPELGTREEYLIGNLPAGRDGKFRGGVASAISEEISRLRGEPFVATTRCEFGCRNLQVLLRDEQLDNMERLSQDLWPYIEGLFCLAARGYYYKNQKTFYQPADEGGGLQHKGLNFCEGDIDLDCHLTQNSISGILRLLTTDNGSVEVGFNTSSYLDLYYAFHQTAASGESVKGDLFNWSQFAFKGEIVFGGEDGIRVGLQPAVVPQIRSVFEQLLADEQASELITRLKRYYGDV